MSSSGRDGSDRPYGADRSAKTVQEALQAFWNARYATEEFVYGTAPNEFLIQVTPRLAPNSRVLCIADGEGRNSVWLAQQGHCVTALDVAAEGMAKAAQLARAAAVELQTVVADVTKYDFGRSCWDAVVSIFLHLPATARRAVHGRCVEALVPGGLFVYEAYGPEQLGRGTGGPPEPHLLHPLEEVLADFAGCGIEHRFSGVRHVSEGRLHRGDGAVVQVLARKLQ